MENIIPKIFISYCWQPEENRRKVEELAIRLSNDGVHVMIDIWDLRAGQNKNYYMEKMVNDETVRKVLVVCNKEYAEKANAKEGGVGIESTIISEKVYNNAEQTKFIPVIFETDNNGKAFIPTFLSSSLYYDLSSLSTYEKEYEKLLRDLYDKPESKRPPLGRMPEYLNDKEPLFLPTAHKVEKIRLAINNSESNANVNIQDYLDTFIQTLSQFKIEKKSVTPNNFIELVEEKIKVMQALKHDFIDFIFSICKSKECTGDLFLDFFEKWLQFYEDQDISLDEENNTLGVANDHFRYFNYDVFLSFATILFENRRFDVLYKLISSHMYIEQNAYRATRLRNNRFFIFNKYNYTLDYYINNQSNHPRYSITAEYISRNTKRLQMQSLVTTDLVLYYLSKMYPCEENSIFDLCWYPRTSCYNLNLEILPKLVSRRYFERIKFLFGVSSIDDFKKLVEKAESSIKNRDYRCNIPNIKQAFMFDKLCTMD